MKPQGKEEGLELEGQLEKERELNPHPIELYSHHTLSNKLLLSLSRRQRATSSLRHCRRRSHRTSSSGAARIARAPPVPLASQEPLRRHAHRVAPFVTIVAEPSPPLSSRVCPLHRHRRSALSATQVESEPNSSGAGSSSGGAASSSGHHQHQHQHQHHHHQVVEEVSVQRVKKEEVNAKISAWQNNKIAKINNRFKRKDAVIEGWESEQARGNALEKCTWFKIQDSRRMYLVQVGSWDRWVKAPTPMMSRLLSASSPKTYLLNALYGRLPVKTFGTTQLNVVTDDMEFWQENEDPNTEETKEELRSQPSHEIRKKDPTDTSLTEALLEGEKRMGKKILRRWKNKKVPTETFPQGTRMLPCPRGGQGRKVWCARLVPGRAAGAAECCFGAPGWCSGRATTKCCPALVEGRAVPREDSSRRRTVLPPQQEYPMMPQDHYFPPYPITRTKPINS
ncbi:hypothetical protein Ahy_A09g044514 [Arachis hypogaea]|uniref:Remorin C-terminal domain-containing protein n=1 Tax=Arachis hypogaea TaxID=3818 RepID=A0A445BK84_ARAHY|nr:hypothetical protein Ahy_A09g044514 [Arachis hypogaea]